MNIDSKNKPLIFWQRVKELDFFFNVTQRIPFVKYDSNGTFFFKYDTKNWTFFEFDSKNGIFFQKNRLTELNLFSSNMTQRIEPFISWIWRLDLDLFSKYDSKSWTIFENSFDMTQRFELILLIWLEEMNSFLIRLEELSFFFNTTQRIEHFWIRRKEFNTLLIWLKDFFSKKRLKELNLFKYDSKCCFCEKNWLKELNSFFFGYDSKNWTLFFWYDSKNWTYFQYDSKYWIFQTKIMTQRIHFLFIKNMTQRIELFFSDKSFFFEKL